jgi:hypothetical protein
MNTIDTISFYSILIQFYCFGISVNLQFFLCFLAVHFAVESLLFVSQDTHDQKLLIKVEKTSHMRIVVYN